MFVYNKHLYFIYVVTNPDKKVLYIGVTNNPEARLGEHYFNRGNSKTFAGKYYCYNLIYYEEFKYIKEAIAREKELKQWSRLKKETLIRTKNPEWLFLNTDFCNHWPPKEKPPRFLNDE
jgi:putative endonuclease